MGKEAVFTLKIEAPLRDAFMAEAIAIDRPASQIIREFMREFVARQQASRDHDAWFHREVEAGMREADDRSVGRIDNDEIEAEWTAERAGLVGRTR